jgi:hypothetical protein
VGRGQDQPLAGRASAGIKLVAKRLKRYQSFIVTVESGQRRIDVVKFFFDNATSQSERYFY